MNNVSNSFFIGALLNGTTVNGFLRSTKPLVQRYKTGTDQFIPDFSQLADDEKPIVYPWLRLVANGGIRIPTSYTWYYNDVALTFGSDDLCTNAGLAGILKRVTFNLTVGSKTYTLPALKVMENLVPISGFDNDMISMSGTIEVSGQSLPFEKLSKEVVIEESTGNQFDVLISNNKGSQFTQDGENLTEHAIVYKDGVQMTNLAGYSFKWSKITGLGDTVIPGIGASVTLTTADVDNVLKIRCDLLKDGSVIASGYDELTDFSDPYDLRLDREGNELLAEGESSTVTPKVVKRSTGDTVPGFVFNFSTKDNEGQDFVLTGQSSSKFVATSVDISYADVIRAQRGIYGYVTASK